MKLGLLQRDTSLTFIVKSLREAILDGTYPPGMQLKQSEIAASLGVSQGPIREALIQLVSEGLVEKSPFRGIYVRVLNKKDIVEIYQLRAALESLAAVLSMPRLQSDDCQRQLEALMEETIQAELHGAAKQAVLADLQFHRFLVSASENTRLIAFWSSLLSQSHTLLRSLYEIQNPAEPMLAANHKMILTAIQAGNCENLCRVIANHMMFAANLLTGHLTEDGQPGAAQEENDHQS